MTTQDLPRIGDVVYAMKDNNFTVVRLYESRGHTPDGSFTMINMVLRSETGEEHIAPHHSPAWKIHRRAVPEGDPLWRGLLS